MKKHSCSTIIIEIQCIQMSIYQTDKRSESWKNMNVGRTMGLERPLCIDAHGVVVARDRTLFWTLKNGGTKGSDQCLKPKVSFIVRSLAILSQISFQFSSVQFSRSSCLTLCDPMNRSTPGLPVQYQLPEFTQTHAHRVSDAIQPSHPLSSPSPPAPNPSQQQGPFQ